MNICAKFDENPAITLQIIKETKRFGRMDGKQYTPPQTKFAGGGGGGEGGGGGGYNEVMQ